MNAFADYIDQCEMAILETKFPFYAKKGIVVCFELLWKAVVT